MSFSLTNGINCKLKMACRRPQMLTTGLFERAREAPGFTRGSDPREQGIGCDVFYDMI